MLLKQFFTFKGKEFDKLIREANIDLEFCQKRLDKAEETIEKLAEKMQRVKWFSRFLRTIGFLVTFYFIYTKYQASFMSFPAFVVSSFISLALWISLAPNRAHAFCKSLQRLNAKHRLLTESLEELDKRMKISSEYKDDVVSGSSTDDESS